MPPSNRHISAGLHITHAVCVFYRSSTNIIVTGASAETATAETTATASALEETAISASVETETAAAVHQTCSNHNPSAFFCKSRKRVDPVNDKLLKILDEPEDPDRSFFLSLYGDYRKLPDNAKLPTKIKLMQVLCTAASEPEARSSALPEL